MGEFYVTLCEYVAIHADGTHSMLRGGIERWTLDDLPGSITFWTFAHLPAGCIHAGKHKLSLELISPRGLAITRVDGEVDVKDADTSTRITGILAGSVQEFGIFTVLVRVGDLDARTRLDVQKTAGEAPR